jgi:hypothetical protein
MGGPRTSGACGTTSAISGTPFRRSQGLRAGLAALTLILMAPAAAVAADLPEFLRGTLSPSNTDWNGVYFGAQIGVANMDTDFGNAASQWVGSNLSNTTLQGQYNVSSWALMPSNTITGQSYGAFVGYNVQWDELVLGFDMAYNHMSSMASSSSAGSINRTVTTSDGTYDVNISGQASDQLIDYATVRGRAGYAFGQFLPYVVLGAAVGRFDYTTTANLQVCGPDFPDTQCSTSTTSITATAGTSTSTTGTTGNSTASTLTTSTDGTPVTSTISTTANSTTGISGTSTTGTSTPCLTGTCNTATSTPGTSTTGTTGTSTTSITGTGTTGATGTGTPSTTSIKPFSSSLSNTKNNAIVAGIVVGLGMDVALLPNVFLRGEWEFVGFAPVSGIRTTLNTARVGIAVKF